MDKNNSGSAIHIDLMKLLYNIFSGLRKFIVLIICLAILGSGLMGFRAWRNYVPLYKSEAIFSVSADITNNNDVFGYSYYYDNTAAQQAAELFPYILQSDAMIERLKLKLDTSFINGSISASSVAETNLFILTVNSTSSTEAYRILTAVIDVYPQMSYLMSGDIQLKMTQEPTIENEPYNTREWIPSAVKGGIVGASIGVFFLIIWAVMQKTVKTSSEVKAFLNVPYLGSVPVIKARRKRQERKNLTIDKNNADSPFNEAFRSIRLKLVRILTKENAKVLLFTSTLQNEGKTTVAVNTAITLAKDGHKVVVVDADLRNASVKKLLKIEKETIGLGEYLERDNVTNIDIIHNKENNLYLLAGDPKNYNMNRVFKRSKLEQILNVLSQNFDYVIMDAPPCAVTADTLKLCRYVQKIVYVIRQDYANQAQIFSSVHSLYDNGADVCGFVMNFKTGKSGMEKYNYGYKYGYGYGYGYSHKYGYGEKSKYGRRGSKSKYGRS